MNSVRSIALVAGLALTSAAFGGNASNLLFPLDGTYTIAPFSGNGAQGSGPASPADPFQRNDDDYTGAIDLGFDFCFFGNNQSQLNINNNGNVTFGGGFSTFTSTGFPVANFPMIAPFWGDVDTRNANSGVVYYKSIDTDNDAALDTFVVTWDNVGYYNQQADKLNTFQVALTNRSGGFGGSGANVAFSYDDMQWTTGSASGGSGGFGGTPATVGINNGNGIDFFQIGRFGAAGNAYDGSGGATDGIDYLDHQDFFFDICGQGLNVPPVALGLPGDRCYQLDVSNGDVLAALINLIGPEIADDISSISLNDIDGAQAAGLMVAIGAVPVPVGTVNLDWNPGYEDVGLYNFELTFADSAGNVTVEAFCINVVPAPGAFALLGLGGLVAVRRRR